MKKIALLFLVAAALNIPIVTYAVDQKILAELTAFDEKLNILDSLKLQDTISESKKSEVAQCIKNQNAGDFPKKFSFERYCRCQLANLDAALQKVGIAKANDPISVGKITLTVTRLQEICYCAQGNTKKQNGEACPKKETK